MLSVALEQEVPGLTHSLIISMHWTHTRAWHSTKCSVCHHGLTNSPARKSVLSSMEEEHSVITWSGAQSWSGAGSCAAVCLPQHLFLHPESSWQIGTVQFLSRIQTESAFPFCVALTQWCHFLAIKTSLVAAVQLGLWDWLPHVHITETWGGGSTSFYLRSCGLGVNI